MSHCLTVSLLSILRHSGTLSERTGVVGEREMTNFRHMLGLDVNSAVQHKARTMKDSKEIMKKRRERAICIVSIRRSQADLVWPVAIKQSPTN